MHKNQKNNSVYTSCNFSAKFVSFEKQETGQLVCNCNTYNSCPVQTSASALAIVANVSVVSLSVSRQMP